MKKPNILLAEFWLTTYITSEFNFMKKAETLLVQF